MKFKIFLFLAFFFGVQQLAAQSLSQAQLNYNEFVKHFSSGGESESAYSALYYSYKEYMAVLDSSRPGSEEYEQSKSRLQKMMPYIYSGAFYYTKKGNSNNTNLFVEAYVDLCVHNAFKNDNIDKGNDYPTFVYRNDGNGVAVCFFIVEHGGGDLLPIIGESAVKIALFQNLRHSRPNGVSAHGEHTQGNALAVVQFAHALTAFNAVAHGVAEVQHLTKSRFLFVLFHYVLLHG